MKSKHATAAILGFLGVFMGALGSHWLRHQHAQEALALWKTAVFYHLVHVPVLLSVAHYQGAIARHATTLMVMGIVLFSGSLYTLAWTGAKWIGWLTPFGGVCLLLGWGLLAWAAFKKDK